MSRVCEGLSIAHASPHDLRRTGRTMLTSERVGVSYEVAERVIAHLVGSAVSRVYDRNEYLREKRAALDAWANELAMIVGEAGVGVADDDSACRESSARRRIKACAKNC
ncbi:MAG: hypothetical protein M0D54_09960 [Hyphomonadaceae bacterium JAD_PAG50586_4]|nr:MAG: hypothetical protein M0D54_09960 [Hyphomonadaceae bacterium JAD_PAG50586_4]